MGIRPPLYMILMYLAAGIIIHCDQSRAEVLDEFNGGISKLSSWQDEYTGPVVLPNHRLERKAQRSPSLRLRFGRRSDPDLSLHWSLKRWFDGDVHQKPIRSPSLRLRFGRRSDPSMISTDSSNTVKAINALHPSIMTLPTDSTYYPITNPYNLNSISNANNLIRMGFLPIDQNSFEKYQVPIDWADNYLHNKMTVNQLDNDKLRNLVMLLNELENRNYKNNDEQLNGGWSTEDVHQSNAKDNKQQFISNYANKPNSLLIADSSNDNDN